MTKFPWPGGGCIKQGSTVQDLHRSMFVTRRSNNGTKIDYR